MTTSTDHAHHAPGTPGTLRTAIFGAGCFWGVQAAFDRIEGVVRTDVGYCGGHTDKPTYRQVCELDTGHAEAVRIVYDPARVTFDELLAAFFTLHNPTQLNRQGPDYGTQYRSTVLVLDDEQKAAAERAIDALNTSGRFAPRKVVTRVEPAGTFWPAEEYHQKYLDKRGQTSCHL
jgi:peptide-methionine (S)-S-oxide reductase